MLVKYCSRDCQIAHRPQHKKECKKRAKELHEIELYKQPPPLEDCPICMIRLPLLGSGRTYMACCGKLICSGCVHAFRSRATKAEHDKCPFCRTPPPITHEELIKRLEKRMEVNDPQAIQNIGNHYFNGGFGLPQNVAKALELWHRAGELDNANAFHNIGNAYRNGNGVEVDEKKFRNYYELAAIGGSSLARYNLGVVELRVGNIERALKHFMIAVKDGDSKALQGIKRMHEYGDATKDDYTNALQSYQSYLSEIKSNQRDEAAASNDEYKYYESAV